MTLLKLDMMVELVYKPVIAVLVAIIIYQLFMNVKLKIFFGSKKYKNKRKRNLEAFKFLMSEEGQRSAVEVSSLCNILNIKLESEQEEPDKLDYGYND